MTRPLGSLRRVDGLRRVIGEAHDSHLRPACSFPGGSTIAVSPGILRNVEYAAAKMAARRSFAASAGDKKFDPVPRTVL